MKLCDTPLVLTIVVSFLAWISPSAAARTWSDRSGAFNVEAELLTVRDGKAYLEKVNGQVRKVPLDLLSKNDLLFIAAMPAYASLVAPHLPKKQASTNSASPTTKMATIKVESPAFSGSIRQFRSERWGFKGLTFSNDGAYLFTLGNDNVTVIDINASTKVAYKIGSGNRSSLAFSPNGKRLVAGSFDGKILVWQHDGKGNLKPENEFSIHRGEVKRIVISPDNEHALTLHSPSTACLWNLKSGEVLACFKDFHFYSGGDVRFSKLGGQAMITDGRLAAVIDISSRKIIQQMPLPKGSGQFAVIAPRGNLISAGRSYDIHTVNTVESSPTTIGEGNEVLGAAAYSPGGTRLLSGGRENVKLWNVETGMPQQKFPIGDSGYVKYVAFSPDGIHFAAIGDSLGKLVEVFRLPEQERGL
jgi:WD40 repeat protein